MTQALDISQLDNPFWSSLQTVHRTLARTAGVAARFAPEHAPFLGVADAQTDVVDALRALVAPGESAYMLGVVPSRLPQGWRIESLGLLAQMVCDGPLEVVDGPQVVDLGQAHRADVLALTALVYPHYFRPQTMELGRYFGIYQDGRLAAMIGERLGADGFREMSAICTHPDFLGHGYAHRLTAMLGNATLEAGVVPFLHVSPRNDRAAQLYQRMGYRVRRQIGFWELHASAA